MGRSSTKVTRATTAAAAKRTVLERFGSRFCAGYEVTVKIDPTQTNGFGRAPRPRGQGDRE